MMSKINTHYNNYCCKKYRIAGNFRGVQFSWMVDICHFAGLIFADAGPHAHYVLYNQAYFVGLIFAVRRSSVKLGKLDPQKISRYMVIYW